MVDIYMQYGSGNIFFSFSCLHISALYCLAFVMTEQPSRCPVAAYIKYKESQSRHLIIVSTLHIVHWWNKKSSDQDKMEWSKFSM